MFDTNLDIKLPGINTAHIHFKIPACLRKEHWNVHITGKWFNYGILLMVMILDLNMWKNQIFYKPYDFGQYTGPNDKIYSVQDAAFLATKNKTTLTYAWRWSNPSPNSSYGMTDILINSRFRNKPLALKGTAFIPCLLAFVVFGVFIWLFGRSDEVTGVEALKLKRLSTIKKVTGASVHSFNDDLDGPNDVETEQNGGDGMQNYGATAASTRVIQIEAKSGTQTPINI